MSSPRLSARAADGGGSATMRAANAPCAHPRPINLALGEPAEAPPAAAVEAAQRCLRDNGARYGPAAGLLPLREAIAVDHASRTGLPRAADEVIVTSGGKQALAETFRVILEPGDEVLVFAPYWPSFLDQVRWAGGTPRIVPPRADLGPDIDAARAAIDRRTRAVIVNDPGNPSSRCATADELRAVAALAADHDLWIVSDEVYDALRFDDRHHLLREASHVVNRTVSVMSFSKRFSMTGYRVGAAIAPPAVVAALESVVSSTTTHASTASQHGALAALETPSDVGRLDRYRARAERAASVLGSVDGVSTLPPTAAFYLFPDLGDWLHERSLTEEAFAATLRTDAGVFVTTGSAFGAPGHIRLSLAVDDDLLDEAVARMIVLLQS